jgi:hypothetical protein
VVAGLYSVSQSPKLGFRLVEVHQLQSLVRRVLFNCRLQFFLMLNCLSALPPHVSHTHTSTHTRTDVSVRKLTDWC